jgi:hypothetical protein
MKIFLLIILSFLIFSCRNYKLHKDITIDTIGNPTATIKIDSNLYFDKTEITNIEYRQFLYWTEEIYGSNSTELLSLIPSQNVWTALKAGYEGLDSVYLIHTAYSYYPVVGVSYDQAQKYSKWRSDRVMELILVKKRIIPYRPIVPKDSVFTIEKYFAGQYYNIKPNKHLLIYPFYSLPDSATYYKAAIFANKLNAKNYKTCRKKFCEDKLLIDCNCLESRPYREIDRIYGPDPLSDTRCVFCRKDLITHLKGNVREMTNIQGEFYGSSFHDSCKVPNNTIRIDTSLINSYTGFRNACTYKQWK